MGQETATEIRLAGAPLGRKRHVCALFSDDAERYEVLLPYIKNGVDVGHRAFHIIDMRGADNHFAALEGAGIDTDVTQESGQLEVRDWNDAYLRGGRFDQDSMLELIEEVLTAGRPRFPLTRLVAMMEWALEDRPGVDDIVEYESRLNYVLPKYDDPVVCTYDLSKFDAAVVMDILRVHPAAIIGGMLQDNPFYVPPDEFLRELRARRGYNSGARN